MKLESNFIHSHTAYPYYKGPLLKSINEIDKKEVHEEWMFPVKSAKVFYANYPLLMRDFKQLSENNLRKRLPKLGELKGKNRKKEIEGIIDRWLIKHSAFISENQAKQDHVNKKIKIGSAKSKGFRPPNYGRAVVYSVEENLKFLGVSNDLGESIDDTGLLDVKGVGVAPDKTPSFMGHSNGLVELHGALRELIFEQLIHHIFRTENSNHQTLPIYAIIELGFDVKLKSWKDNGTANGNGKKVLVDQGCYPTALVVRRAHNRPPGGGDLPTYGSHSQIAKIDIEFMLRKYGITSANGTTNIYIEPTEDDFTLKYGDEVIPIPKGIVRETLLKVSKFSGKPLVFDGINIQITEDPITEPFQATLVDFGNYVLREDFSNPVLSLVIDRVLRWGGAVWPTDRIYEHPNPKYRIPFSLWGKRGPACNFQNSPPKLKIASFIEVCELYAKGNLTKQEVMQCVHTYLLSAFPKMNTVDKKNI